MCFGFFLWKFMLGLNESASPNGSGTYNSI